MNDPSLIVTVPAHARFGNIVTHPCVEAVRVNTTMPIKKTMDETIAEIIAQAGSKEVWIDLKCRQLRITQYAVEIQHEQEIHRLTLSHPLTVETPAEAWIDDGNYRGTILAIENGNQLVIAGSTTRKEGLLLAGPGEIGIRPSMSVNILHPTLEIQGYLTERDTQYIEACKQQHLHNYMLSYVEQESDICDLLARDPEARIVAKIENPKGLDFVRRDYQRLRSRTKELRLMAARGDFYVELERPDLIIDACQQIVAADPRAILASRMLGSTKEPERMPACADLFDIYAGLAMGYRRFITGDDVSATQQGAVAAIGLFDALRTKYDRGML